MRASIMMKTATLAFAFVAGHALAGDRVPEPTAFESFIANPNAIVEFEQWVGSIVSTDAKLSVTALAAHDPADPARRMQGLRLTMEDNNGSDSVHVEEPLLDALRHDLADVEQGRAFMKLREPDAPWTVAGTASCWMPKRPMRILCPSHRVGPDGRFLLLAVFGGRTFEFPERGPAELRALLDQAQAMLESRRAAP